MSPGDAAYDKRQRLGAELRMLRDVKRLSGRVLAQRIGMAQSMLSRIERGEALPSTSDITAWAEAVDASPAQTQRLSEMLMDVVRTEAETSLAKAMTGSAGQLLAELLHTGIRQLGYRMQRIRQIGVSRADDLAPIADYLRELAEHGHNLAHLAIDTIDEGGDAEIYLGHVGALMEAAQTFAADSYGLLSKQDE